MTSKRRESINLVSFIGLSFLESKCEALLKSPIFDVTDKSKTFDFILPLPDKIEDNFVHVYFTNSLFTDIKLTRCKKRNNKGFNNLNSSDNGQFFF